MAQLLDEPLEELKKYDSRVPVEDLKRRAETDPTFGLALRTVVEKGLSGEDLLKWAKRARFPRKSA